MVDPLTAKQILIASGGGAMVVMFGAFYAFFFSLNRLRPDTRWNMAAIASFVLLVMSSMMMAYALSLDMFWRLGICFILICYYFAPFFIWHLSVATHAEDDAADDISVT